MESMAIQAVDNPGKAYEFKKFHLNMFMHDTEALIPMDHFRQCQKFPVEEDDLLGQVCWGGLDIGAVSDWTALLLIFKTDDGIKVLSYYWIPEGTLVEQQRKTKMPIVEWASRDLIRTTEGNVTDFDVVRKDINEICDKFKVEKIGLDPHNATQLATQLDQDGLPLEWFRQGFITMNSPVNEMVRLIISHQLHFGNDPVMGWMMENAQAIHDSCGNVRIDRQNRNCKVDAVVSLAEAIGVAGLCEKKESVYKSRGLIVL